MNTSTVPDSGEYENTIPDSGDCENTIPDSGDYENTVPDSGDCENTIPDSGDYENTVPDSGDYETPVPGTSEYETPTHIPQYGRWNVCIILVSLWLHYSGITIVFIFYLFINCKLYSTFSIVQCLNALYRL